MTWQSEDDRHEGYIATVLADGSTSSSSSKDGPLVAVRDENGVLLAVEQQRSEDEIVGWVLSCSCAPGEDGSPAERWTGQRWSRVATAAAQDAADGRIYAEPGSALDIDGRADVRDLAYLAWREHCGTARALQDIRAAKDAITTGERWLTNAVRLARTAGHTWDQIGQAAGVSRQSAHERWSHLDA